MWGVYLSHDASCEWKQATVFLQLCQTRISDSYKYFGMKYCGNLPLFSSCLELKMVKH